MDTLFLTLVAFSIITGVLTIVTLIEWLMLVVLNSKTWREMPRGTIPHALAVLITITGSGSFMGIIIFCVHMTLGWAGLMGCALLFTTITISAMYLEHAAVEPKPMATRLRGAETTPNKLHL